MTHNDQPVSKSWHSPELRRISVRTTSEGGSVDTDFIIGGPPHYSGPIG